MWNIFAFVYWPFGSFCEVPVQVFLPFFFSYQITCLFLLFYGNALPILSLLLIWGQF